MTRGLSLIDYTPELDDTRFVERLRGRTFEDHPRAAAPQAFMRLPAPDLRHTAGGCSASTCVEAGEVRSKERSGSRRTRNRAPKGVRICKGCGCTFQPTVPRQVFHEVPCATVYFKRQDRDRHRRAAQRSRLARARAGAVR